MKNKGLSVIVTMAVALVGSFVMTSSGLKAYATEELWIDQTVTEKVIINNDKISSEDFLEGFMHKQGSSGYTFNVKNSNRRAALSPVNGYIYDQVKTKIIGIANGQESSATLKFSVPVKTLMGTAWKDKYTAADLGLTTLFRADGKPTNEAMYAIYNLKGCDVGTVINAICKDYPYEMYWFGNEIVYSANYYMFNKTEGIIKLAETDTVTIELTVAKEYSAGGKEGTSDVNTAKCQAVKSAADYANQIISDNASKSDYEKLEAYRDIICKLNTYNKAAMSDNVPYGNPWQMIYVFDKDPSTNVVCEGYAKAFKYLCDGSRFQSGLIECYLISGQMVGATGAGPHMWNHVRMDDGKIYLVDVTNCDSGTIGYPDKLFLKGGEDSNGDTWLEANGTDVNYAFDSETKALYSHAELTWSKNDYPVKDKQDDSQTQDDSMSQEGEQTVTPANGKVKAGSIEYKTSKSGKAVVISNSNKKIKSVNLADKILLNGASYEITEIRSGAFKNSKNISKVVLGSNIKKIGANAFSGCSKLGKIYINANNLKSVGKNAFKGVKKKAKVTVYARDKQTYNKAVKMLKKAGLKKAKFIFKKK